MTLLLGYKKYLLKKRSYYPLTEQRIRKITVYSSDSQTNTSLLNQRIAKMDQTKRQQIKIIFHFFIVKNVLDKLYKTGNGNKTYNDINRNNESTYYYSKYETTTSQSFKTNALSIETKGWPLSEKNK
jgi:hypothetical protein